MSAPPNKDGNCISKQIQHPTLKIAASTWSFISATKGDTTMTTLPILPDQISTV